MIAFLFIAVLAAVSSDEQAGQSVSGVNGGVQDGTGTTTTTIAPNIPPEFSADCPVELSASVSDNIIGVPELRCVITNRTDKEIAAVKLYFLPKDVYGNDVDSIFTTNQLFTDESIGKKGSCTRSWQMLDDDIKSGEVYIYSVYFADGTEWGDRDASVSKIKKYGVKVSAEN